MAVGYGGDVTVQCLLTELNYLNSFRLKSEKVKFDFFSPMSS